MWVSDLNLLHYVINVIWIEYLPKKLINLFVTLLGLVIPRKEIKLQNETTTKSLVGDRSTRENRNAYFGKKNLKVFLKKILFAW